MKLTDPTLRTRLASLGIGHFDALTSRYSAGPEELRRYAGNGPVLTDDRPLVEYFLSLPLGEQPADLSGVRGDVQRILGD